jgi:Putative beta-lactamase-inhibitor-like, PepSY-like
MKIRNLAFIALTLIISSCSKENNTSTEQDISVTEVSERIANYVDNNYPDAYISSAVSVTNNLAKTIVTLNTTEELAFNSNDNFIGPGNQFHAGHMHGHNGGHPHGGGHGHCHGFEHGDFDDIPVDSLSSTITVFISMNYAGYRILHSENDSSCAVGSVIEVFVRTTGAEPVKLIFDTAGSYLMSASKIDYSTTPAAVQASITTNYSGFTPRHRSEKFTLVNGQSQYVVYLFNGTTHKRVLLADDGTVICEQ